jgi:uncharacterized membrane protein
MNIIIILNIVLAALGLYVAIQIKKNKSLKQSGEKMVCLVGHKCDEVVFSDYSKFFGINLELMGQLYYGLIALFYLAYLLLPQFLPELAVFIVLGMTFGGFLFSIYLTYVQVFKLKSFCAWCLSSAGLSTLIFFVSYALAILMKPEVIEYIKQVNPYIRGLEFISIVVGVAVFLVLEILTIKFLKDFKISIQEDKILKNIAQAGWFVLFLIILSNFGIYLPERVIDHLSFSEINYGIFWLEIILLVLISVNSLISHVQVIPDIKKASLVQTSVPVLKIKRARIYAICASFVSIALWITLFSINFIV